MGRWPAPKGAVLVDALTLGPAPGLELCLPADWLVTQPFPSSCAVSSSVIKALSWSFLKTVPAPYLPRPTLFKCKPFCSHMPAVQQTLSEASDDLSLVLRCACARTPMETLDRWPCGSWALCPGTLLPAGVVGGGGGLAEGLMMLREAGLQGTVCLCRESDWKGPSSRSTFSFKTCP